jgi:hypothetical protein
MPRHILHAESSLQKLRSNAVSVAVRLLRDGMPEATVKEYIRTDPELSRMFAGYSASVAEAKLRSVLMAAMGLSGLRKAKQKRSG